MPSRRHDIDHRAKSKSHDNVRVKTEVLRTAAADGERHINDLQTVLAELASMVAASTDFWAGDAGNFYREAFEAAMKRMVAEVDELSSYPHELVAYADKHEGRYTASEVEAYQAKMEADRAQWVTL